MALPTVSERLRDLELEQAVRKTAFNDFQTVTSLERAEDRATTKDLLVRVARLEKHNEILEKLVSESRSRGWQVWIVVATAIISGVVSFVVASLNRASTSPLLPGTRP